MIKFILAPLPAILIGAAAMCRNNVPAAIWIQNIAGFVAGVVLLLIVSRKPGITESVFVVPVSILLLLFTFIDPGPEGVRRWVSIGPFRLYMASIVLPSLIAGLSKMMNTVDRRIPPAIAIGVSFLLALQPDASQTTAFVVPTAVILFVSLRKNIVRYGVLSLFAVIVILLWTYPDDLPPVPYVEGIMNMAAGMGTPWFVSGILALALPPLPFFLRSEGNDALLSMSLGIYYAVVLLSPLFGDFPVPFMGYGISPIIGYYGAVAYSIGSGAGKVDNSTSSYCISKNMPDGVRREGTVTKPRIYAMPFADVYPLYMKKAERKGRTKAEVDEIIFWLTGYDERGLRDHIEKQTDLETFFERAPHMHENASLIKGVICGQRVEEIEDDLMRKIRYLDKLVDELAKGKAMDKILRK